MKLIIGVNFPPEKFKSLSEDGAERFILDSLRDQGIRDVCRREDLENKEKEHAAILKEATEAGARMGEDKRKLVEKSLNEREAYGEAEMTEPFASFVNARTMANGLGITDEQIAKDLLYAMKREDRTPQIDPSKEMESLKISYLNGYILGDEYLHKLSKIAVREERNAREHDFKSIDERLRRIEEKLGLDPINEKPPVDSSKEMTDKEWVDALKKMLKRMESRG